MSCMHNYNNFYPTCIVVVIDNVCVHVRMQLHGICHSYDRRKLTNSYIISSDADIE